MAGGSMTTWAVLAAAGLVLLVSVPLCDAEAVYDIYCGKENCYEVLDVDPEASPGDIRRVYRKLAHKLHPDRNKDEDTTEAFQRVATAYEVLKDEETRKNYDYLLAHPDEWYRNMYMYYKNRAAPKVPVAPILVVLITMISVVQYYHWHNAHQSAVKFAMDDVKIVAKAKRLAEDEGLFAKKMSKDEKNKVIRGVVERRLNEQGVCLEPQWTDLLWSKILLLPLILLKWIAWNVSWVWRIRINGQEYTDADKEYLIEKNISVQWEYFHDQDLAWERELWIKENAVEYLEEIEEEKKAAQRASGRYKQEKRWRKKYGAPSANYLDD
eukprot:m.48012 g.48012  ORF g.48012 m.48012 type:complete len:325 (-) comp11962_c0_seq1:65-1039(-)